MPPTTPVKLGRYEIVDELGKGAMGVVYLARDPLIGRLVALKTFRIGYSVKDHELLQFRARFIREAQSAGILSHPAIVTVHDVVEESAEGATFIAMEYVRGTNLKELLQGEEPLAPGFVVGVVTQVAEALDYAHSKGVVHRDIKPANILITDDLQVKITDFGIARLDTSNLTVEGQLLGTPNYMAPEQIQGKEVDHRADIFSLGVVVYEMLARRKPFQGENLTVVTHRIVYEPFTPLEQHVAGVPPAVTDLLQRALEKSPQRRYARAGELAADLRRALSAPADLNDTVAAQSPAKARRSRPGALGRVLGIGAGAPTVARASAQARRVVFALAGLALGLVAALGALALLPADLGGDLVEAESQARGFEFLRLLQRGEALLEAGDAAAAAQAFADAERLAPDPAAARHLRERAERQAAAQAIAVESAAALERGRAAFAAGRYDEARAAAEEELARSPEDPAATALLADARAALERRSARQRAADASAAESAAAAPNPAVPVETQPSAAPVLGAAVLQIQFSSEAPEGVLTIYASQGQILRESFRFVRRSGLFRSAAVPGRLERTLTMPPGEVMLRIYVALADRPTRMVERQGNFLSGRSRVLSVAVSAAGDVSARLD